IVLYPSHGGQIDFRDFVEKPSYDQLEHSLPKYERVWLVLSHAGPSGQDDTSMTLESLIAASHRGFNPRDFSGLEVFLYDENHLVLTK
ncbi:MAG TPA: ADP-ribosylglycohydrolase family protein, partial [Terriglobales bacterium]|nr:ADP-ribosylglycohydrolase family protein [Terriglobales bacterium]